MRSVRHEWAIAASRARNPFSSSSLFLPLIALTACSGLEAVQAPESAPGRSASVAGARAPSTTARGGNGSLSDPALAMNVNMGDAPFDPIAGAGAAGTAAIGGSHAAVGGAGATFPSEFPAVSDFAKVGPFATTTQVVATPACTMFRPEPLGTGGVRHPVILWGNGTGANPGIYAEALTHWASHGFIVAAATTPSAGTGTAMLACLDYVTAQNATASSVYFGKVDTTHVGASGHSQGGGGSIMVGRDPRVTATAPLEPYVLGFGYLPSAASLQQGPMFLMSGGADTIALPRFNQLPVFDRANEPVFWGTLALATHTGTAIGDIGGFRGPATAWFRLHLMGDERARPLFYGPLTSCGLCSDAKWSVLRKLID